LVGGLAEDEIGLPDAEDAKLTQKTQKEYRRKGMRGILNAEGAKVSQRAQKKTEKIPRKYKNKLDIV
jgi:hypothetical protein